MEDDIMSLPKFYKCHRKEQSRYDTIIDAYRTIFDVHRIPSDRQYWTLCNYQADDMGNIPEASEIGQLIYSELLTANQVHGVDFYEHIINHNRQHIPEANWYHGELYKTIINNIDTFKPAIINIDLNCMVRRSIMICTKILRLLNKMNHENVMIVLNVMVTNPRAKNTLTIDVLNDMFVRKFLMDETFLMNAEGWNVYNDKLYSYHGTGKHGKTIMSSLILWKK